MDFTRELDRALKRGLKKATRRSHEYATIEHLLEALLDDEDVAKVLRAAGAKIAPLKRMVSRYLDTELTELRVEGVSDAGPTSGFQRIVQRANLEALARESNVTTIDALIALWVEQECYAVHFLKQAGISGHSLRTACSDAVDGQSVDLIEEEVAAIDFGSASAGSGLVQSASWTGRPSIDALSAERTEKLKTEIVRLEGRLDEIPLSNEVRSQALSYAAAIKVLADAPVPPVDTIWDIIQKLSTISGIAGLLVAIIALFK